MTRKQTFQVLCAFVLLIVTMSVISLVTRAGETVNVVCTPQQGCTATMDVGVPNDRIGEITASLLPIQPSMLDVNITYRFLSGVGNGSIYHQFRRGILPNGQEIDLQKVSLFQLRHNGVLIKTIDVRRAQLSP